MSPAVNVSEPSFEVTPLPRTEEQKFNFGATVLGLDLNNITDEAVEKLKETVWTHKVVVIKGQRGFEPKKQWDLVRRFDPQGEQVHGHGDLKTFKKIGGFLAKPGEVHGFEGAENVRLVGKGYQGVEHYNFKNLTVQGLSNEFHAEKQNEEEFKQGFTRFQRWHIDAPLYERHPGWFTTLYAHKLPSGPDLTIRWDDGSGFSIKTPPGSTAYFSTSQLYSLLSPDEQKVADHSWVEYAPHPYLWISKCQGNTTGLGIKSEGKERPLEELGEYHDSSIKRYPLVWVNPVTGEKAFQVHGICARKLFIRSSENEEPKIIDNLEEVRAYILNLQSRILRPEYILLPRIEEGDVVIWDNYGLFHSAVDYPLEKYGPRTMHQAHLAASRGPVGPVPIPVSVHG